MSKKNRHRISNWRKRESRKKLRALAQRREFCKIEGKKFYKDFPEEHQKRISPIPKELNALMHFYSIGEIVRWKIMSFKRVCKKLGGPINFDELSRDKEEFMPMQQQQQLVVHEIR